MRILLSNDDGVYAPGLAMAAHGLQEIADVTVMAPDRNRSGASNSLTLERPLRIKTLANGFISVEGTPTDCVHLGLTGYLEEKVDMVVSGINAGANLGDDVVYSGTVAAATEGRYLGYPAVAVSLASKETRHYQTAVKVTHNLVKCLQNDPLPRNMILNVNVPDVPFEELQGMEITRLGTRHSAEPTIKEMDPRGNTIYWVGPPGAEEDAGVGTDFYAISAKKVSITPLQLDLTDYKSFDMLSAWLNELNVI